jgi:molybdenum cofactor guanylyltransferase
LNSRSFEPLGPAIDATGVVLAGGRSRRMGRDKALLDFGGRPLIARALSILHEAGLPATIAAARPDLGSFAPVVEDQVSGEGEISRGPLAGVCAALASSAAPHAVFLSVDLPLVPASLLAYLLRHARITASGVTVASLNGRAQTFPAVIDRSLLPALEMELAAGRLGCLTAFEAAAARERRRFCAVPVEYLVQSGQVAHPQGLPAAHWFLNVNTPADLERAARLTRRLGRIA